MATTSTKKIITKDPKVIKAPKSVKGLTTAIVTDLIDPEGDFRVKINLPGLSNSNESFFARLASFDAGNDRGAFFMPEIGDEVIVGFINNEFTRPVVLGSLYNNKNTPPIIPEDTNHQKGYVSRSQIKILIDDNNKIITIDTPAGNSITLDESGMKIAITDQNQNKVIMDPSGITIESTRQIEIIAGSVLSLRAGTSLSVTAPSISIKADADISIEGATVKLAGQGPTQITGMPVKIN
jgi:uncharacterized protein involved in type VI secretion and phage assembly